MDALCAHFTQPRGERGLVEIETERSAGEWSVSARLCGARNTAVGSTELAAERAALDGLFGASLARGDAPGKVVFGAGELRDRLGAGGDLGGLELESVWQLREGTVFVVHGR